MARSEARRQKQLARKKANRSAKRAVRQRERSRSTTDQMSAPGAQIADCLLARRDLVEQGIASAMCSVRRRTGELGVAVYLIDRWCLQVKDVFGRIMPAGVYADWLDDFRKKTGAKPVAPATLRRLIDDAVAFARSCGQPPHLAFAKYQGVLARVDPAQAQETFEMGHGGRPHFFAGPDDDTERCALVMSRLRRSVGEGNFDFTVPLLPGLMLHPLPSAVEPRGDIDFDGEDSFEDDDFDDGDDDEFEDEFDDETDFV